MSESCDRRQNVCVDYWGLSSMRGWFLKLMAEYRGDVDTDGGCGYRGDMVDRTPTPENCSLIDF